MAFLLIFGVLLALALALLAAGQLGLLRGSAPTGLGVQAGKLKAPSRNPNSACSQANQWSGHPQQGYASIAPLALLGGDGPATLARIKTWVEGTPGAVVVESQPGYLYAQFTTRWLKFTDDAEFWFDPGAGVVHVRSASRLGRKDFGVNRDRIEALRRHLAR